VKVKLNAVPDVLKGKRVVVVDDSMVRGTTSRKIVKMIRHAGAKEVHVRISSPPIISPCFFGIDMGTRWELIAGDKQVEEIREHVGADTLGYLSVEGLIEALGLPKEKFCLACFTGSYPVPVPLQMDKLALEPVGTDRHEFEWPDVVPSARP
ncbi:MAG: hypothetical protein Q8S13_10940, partial [Dehalococcoidia bacterium]|nr:hypothetical protein [Dehalococcoidia bacterium]